MITEMTVPLLSDAVFNFAMRACMAVFFAAIMPDVAAFTRAACACRNVADVRAAMVRAAVNK